MNVIRDIWLCDDCVPVAVDGDYTHLDYHYTEKEADQRVRDINAGLDALPGLVPDDGDDQMECLECGFMHSKDQFTVVTENEGTDDEEIFCKCPQCHSLDTRDRESGNDEFSHSHCDCCGSSLSGSRMRFAQLVEEVSPQLTLPGF